MRSTLLLGVCFTVWFTINGCGEDGASETSKTDASVNQSNGSNTTGDASASNTPGKGPGNNSPSADAAPAPPDASDAPDSSNFEPGPIDCRADDDCPENLSCQREVVGGACVGCGTGPGTECAEGFDCRIGNICRRSCENSDDCPAGQYCSGRQMPVCAPLTCIPDVLECPLPYVCTNGTCTRPRCADTPCPDPLVCIDDVCIEPE